VLSELYRQGEEWGPAATAEPSTTTRPPTRCHARRRWGTPYRECGVDGQSVSRRSPRAVPYWFLRREPPCGVAEVLIPHRGDLARMVSGAAAGNALPRDDEGERERVPIGQTAQWSGIRFSASRAASGGRSSRCGHFADHCRDMNKSVPARRQDDLRPAPCQPRLGWVVWQRWAGRESACGWCPGMLETIGERAGPSACRPATQGQIIDDAFVAELTGLLDLTGWPPG
jgi:hypothetical protein